MADHNSDLVLYSFSDEKRGEVISNGSHESVAYLVACRHLLRVNYIQAKHSMKDSAHS